MTDKEKCGCHDHDCDCQHDHEEADFITLEFDDGEEVECEVIGVFDFEGKNLNSLTSRMTMSMREPLPSLTNSLQKRHRYRNGIDPEKIRAACAVLY